MESNLDKCQAWLNKLETQYALGYGTKVETLMKLNGFIDGIEIGGILSDEEVRKSIQYVLDKIKGDLEGDK